MYQVSLPAAEPGSSVSLEERSRPPSHPRRVRGGGAASPQGSSLPLAGGFLHLHSRTATAAGCSTCSRQKQLESTQYKELDTHN